MSATTPPPVKVPNKLLNDPELQDFFKTLQKSAYDVWFKISGGKHTITAVFDGGGNSLQSGALCFVRIPYNGTIVAVTLLGDQTGSAIVDVQKDAYANFPPTSGDSICASSKPSISSGIKSEDTVLTDWSKSVTAGDVFLFNLDSVSGFSKLTLNLDIIKT